MPFALAIYEPLEVPGNGVVGNLTGSVPWLGKSPKTRFLRKT
jgi:hypothetical protein